MNHWVAVCPEPPRTRPTCMSKCMSLFRESCYALYRAEVHIRERLDMQQMTQAEKQSYIRENIVEVQTVDGFTPCWIWQGTLTHKGYGQIITIGGHATAPHRHSYFAFVGTVSAQLDLDHLCYVPACANPEHLEPVTHAENIRRMLERAKALGVDDPRLPREMCMRGLHKLEEPNLRWKTDRNGVKRRTCKTCAKANDRARYSANQMFADL